MTKGTNTFATYCRKEERRERKEKKKKVRWKRMYVGHVATGIASMCHRGNHAGNAEAHLTTLPPCIYLTPGYSVYIYCLRTSTNRVLLSRSLFPCVVSSFSVSSARRFRSARTSTKFARRGNPNAKIRKLSSHSNNAVLGFNGTRFLHTLIASLRYRVV